MFDIEMFEMFEKCFNIRIMKNGDHTNLTIVVALNTESGSLR